MTKDFNFEQALKDLQDGILSPLIKQLTEAALNAELEQHFENDNFPNRKMVKQAKRLSMLLVVLILKL